jgi:Hypoxia induced protein conserved region
MDVMMVLVVLALGATVVALFMGLLSMSGGEQVDRKLAEPLMWARVGLQALTVALLSVALLLR